MRYIKGHHPADHPGANRQEKADWIAGVKATKVPATGLSDREAVPWDIDGRPGLLRKRARKQSYNPWRDVWK